MVFVIKTDSDQRTVKWEIRKTEWEATEAKGRIHADQRWVSSAESSMGGGGWGGRRMLYFLQHCLQTLIPLLEFFNLVIYTKLSHRV